MNRIGVDLGGTKIALMAVGDDGEIRFHKRVATPQGDYRETVRVIVELVLEAETHLGEKASIGIGTPGAMSQTTGLMKNCNSTCLNHMPLKADLEVLLSREIRLANDANCFVLSEATDGAGAGASVIFGIIIGTGTGGGLVVNGQLITGINAITGEWGHNPLPWPDMAEFAGPQCYCGKRSCIETYLSGPGLQNDHCQVTGQRLSPAEIVERAERGDAGCQATLQRYEDRFARSLAQVINILDPDVIVLGGGLSNIERLYINVPQRWIEYVFSDRVETRLVPPLHGDTSGVRGASWLWNSQ